MSSQKGNGKRFRQCFVKLDEKHPVSMKGGKEVELSRKKKVEF